MPDPGSLESKKEGIVMVVDDEIYLLDLLQRMIEKTGRKALCCTDCESACLAYSGNFRDIELVITDFSLPDGDGLELLTRLREINPEVRCILASGSLGSGSGEAGFCAFLQKPYTFYALKSLIDEVCRA